MHNIVVYGPGCAKCTALEDVTKQAVQELHLDASLEKVTDAMQFAVVGVLVTPALAVDGKVLVSGRVPSKDESQKFFRKLFRLILPGRNPAVVPGQQNLRYLKKMVPSRKRHPLAAGAVAAVKHSKGVPDGKRL